MSTPKKPKVPVYDLRGPRTFTEPHELPLLGICGLSTYDGGSGTCHRPPYHDGRCSSFPDEIDRDEVGLTDAEQEYLDHRGEL